MRGINADVGVVAIEQVAYGVLRESHRGLFVALGYDEILKRSAEDGRRLCPQGDSSHGVKRLAIKLIALADAVDERSRTGCCYEWHGDVRDDIGFGPVPTGIVIDVQTLLEAMKTGAEECGALIGIG